MSTAKPGSAHWTGTSPCTPQEAPRPQEELRGSRFFLLFFLFFLSGGRPIHCRHAASSPAFIGAPPLTRRSSSRMRTACSSASFAFVHLRFSRRRKETVVPSTLSSPCSARTTRRGASPAECRTVRSLRCGSGSERQPGRSPGGGDFCARGLSFLSCSLPGLVAVFSPLWCVAATKAMRAVCCSCRHHKRSRRPLRRRATPPAGGRRLNSFISSQQQCATKDHKPV